MVSIYRPVKGAFAHVFKYLKAAFHTAATEHLDLRLRDFVPVEKERMTGDLNERLAFVSPTPLCLHLNPIEIMKGLQADTDTADLLLKAQQLKALDRPSNRDYGSVLSFMENDGGQLYEEDMEFI